MMDVNMKMIFNNEDIEKEEGGLEIVCKCLAHVVSCY